MTLFDIMVGGIVFLILSVIIGGAVVSFQEKFWNKPK